MRGRDQVRFVGHQSRAGTIALYQSADIYCLPSHGEPYGITAMEAMSCGKPLVVTDAGGLGGLVDDQGGLRVPVADPERLADALCTLIADPARRQAMGEHNRSPRARNHDLGSRNRPARRDLYRHHRA